MPLTRKTVQPLIERALAEDAAGRDITSRAVLQPTTRIRAAIIAKQSGILAGGPLAVWTFQTMDPALRCALKRRDGARLSKGQICLTVEGSARSIFAAERTALNLLGHLCGIATLTQEYVRRVPRRVAILDTRKTLPGLRALEKYAVRMGGGLNHRNNLSEAILIKTNHLKTLRTRSRPQSTVHSPQLIQQAIARAKRARPRKFIEVEVANMSEFREALAARPDAILLDNWPIPLIQRAVAIRNHSSLATPARRSLSPGRARHSPLLEVSGGVTLANVRAIARTGVERISIGRLTHSAPALDVSLAVL